MSKKRIIQADSRGRITLPKELRKGVSHYIMTAMPDGSLKFKATHFFETSSRADIRAAKKFLKALGK